MLKSKAKQKIAGVAACAVLGIGYVVGVSVTQPQEAHAAEALTSVNVITIINDIGMPPSPFSTGGNPTATSSLYSPKSTTSGNFKVNVNPAAPNLSTSVRPTQSGLLIDISDPATPTDITTVQMPATAGSPLIVWKGGVQQSTTLPASDFQYDVATGQMTIDSKYQTKNVCIYNYVYAAQVASKPVVYATETVDGTTKTLTASADTPSKLTRNGKTYVAQGNITTEKNAIFHENPQNGGSGAYVSYDIESVGVYAVTYDNTGAIKDYWELNKGNDYTFASDGTIKFQRTVNALGIVVDTVAKTKTDVPTPALSAKGSGYFNFVPAIGCQYRLTGPNGYDSGWVDSPEFTGLAAGSYKIQYKRVSDGKLSAIRTFSSKGSGGNYDSPFAVGDTFTCDVDVLWHYDVGPATNFNCDLSSWSGSNQKAVDKLNAAGINDWFWCISPGAAYSDGRTLTGLVECTGVDVESGIAQFYLHTEDAVGCQNVGSGFQLALDQPMVVEVTKASADEDFTKANADNPLYTLEGAEYGIWSEGSDPEAESPVTTMTTDAAGQATSENLKAGNYFIKEINASPGYAIDPEQYEANGGPGETVSVNVTEQPQWAKFEFSKLDNQSGEGTHEGGATLENAVFEIKFYKNDNCSGTADRTWYIATDINGKATIQTIKEGSARYETLQNGRSISKTFTSDAPYTAAGVEGNVLPVGSISVQEVLNPVGYLFDNGTVRGPGEVHQYTIDSDTGTIETEIKIDNPASPKDQSVRGDLVFDKKGFSDQRILPYVPFVIYGVNTGEWHVILTDENGRVTTNVDERPREDDGAGITVNMLDQYVESFQAEGGEGIPSFRIKEGMEDALCDCTAAGNNNEYANIFFTGYGPLNDPDGTLAAKVSSDTQVMGFPYDEYRIIELPCKANEGLALVSVPFNIVKHDYEVPLGTINDLELKIGTTAMDSATGGHIGSSVAETTTIIDEVEYKGLTPGTTYIMTGKLNYKVTDESGAVTAEPVKIDGVDVVATTEFTADEADGVIDVNFDVPTELLKGRDVVVFESVADKNIPNTPIASHEDAEDEGQSVSFPEIGTQAYDKTTGEQNGAAIGETTTVVDTVEYKNLVPGKTYTMTGKLMDEGTKAPLMTEDNQEITSSVEFVAEDRNGTVDMEFEVPTNLLVGKTIVVFEDLYVEDVRVATHADIEDEGQTVWYPGIHTNATDGLNGLKEGLAADPTTIIDEVSYENLIKGETYTMSGVLMDKATGQPLLDENGQEIRASKTFVAGEEEAPAPEEEEIVVPEENANNENAEANDNSNANAEENANTESDEPKEEEKAPVEHCSGVVTIEFTASKAVIEGHTTVVFEDLHWGIDTDAQIVADHRDIDDEAQTVYYPKIRTTAGIAGQHVYEGTDEMIPLIDVVAYENLQPGKEYTITGTIWTQRSENGADDAQVDALKNMFGSKAEKEVEAAPLIGSDGNPVTATVTFVPETPSGTTEVPFMLNVRDLANYNRIDKDGSLNLSVGPDGTTQTDNETIFNGNMVVFEDLYIPVEKEGGVAYELVGQHADINDKDQTVGVKIPNFKLVKTGEKPFDFTPVAVLGAAALAAGAFALVRRRIKK